MPFFAIIILQKLNKRIYKVINKVNKLLCGNLT